MFINILNNAFDTMPEGGRISFDAWNDIDNVYVAISDSGEGMSEDVAKRIFDPYFTTKQVVGTGLGMSMAYGIITSLGGKINVESAVGKGTTFTLQFPITIKSVNQTSTLEQENETNEMNLRILVVDDEEAICKVLHKFLSECGHKFNTVNKGEEAIELMNNEVFDLVLCDLAIPEVVGYDVMKTINSLEKRPILGIITGWAEKLNLKEEGIKVDFLLKKPFNLSELRNQINKLDF